ncbi:MAG: STAS domain-containing protein [Chitinispirillaceae bacterium]|nr:STAS domain-containing protein [Chitinispirillaceae bacterium]
MPAYHFTAHKEFTVIRLQGDLRISELPALSPPLQEHIERHPLHHIVLDLEEVTLIDRSITTLFTNIQKRLESNGKKLFALNPRPDVAPVLKTAGINETISDIYALERDLNQDVFSTFSVFSHDENGLQRLHCGCEVCGSRSIAGYLLNPNAYSWWWQDDELFPRCRHSSGEEFDFFSMLPIVCRDCHMVSTDIRHFNLIAPDNVISVHSTLSESAKVHLTKNIKKRKKIIDSCADSDNEQFFLYPRGRSASFYLYLLADSSIRTLALNKNDADPFQVGFLNYLAIRYADRSAKDELIDNCRTWLTQARNEQLFRTHGEQAQALFILFSAALSLEKVKEANALIQEFSAMMENISSPESAAATITSPLFWFTQVQAMWRREIARKSSSFSRHAAG